MAKTMLAVLLAGTSVIGSRPNATAADARWRAILEPLAGSKVRGGVTVEAKGTESTRFTITIRDATPNASLAWHMHSGTCANPGNPVGSGYPELHVGPGGTAEAAATLAVAAPGTGDYLVQVHGPTGAPISCGMLKSIGTGTP